MIHLILIILFLTLFLVLGLIPIGILALVGRKNPQLKSSVSHKMVRQAFRIILFLGGIRLTVEGKENLPSDQAVLYIGNHRSLFDAVIAGSLFPAVTGFIAKKETAKVPLLSLWMKNIYCLFLDRSSLKEGLKTILTGIEYMKNGISICVFPEGTRNRNASELDMLEFKEGSMKLAEKSKCPLIPMAIHNSAEILETHFPFVRSTRVTVRFGAPIDLNTLSKEDKKFSGAYVQKQILEMLKDMQ